MTDHPDGWSVGEFEAAPGQDSAYRDLLRLRMTLRRLFFNSHRGPVAWAECVKAAFEKGIIQPGNMRFILRRGGEIEPKSLALPESDGL